MNIFILDKCPVKAAQYQCDKHVVKMCLETAQILCTALRESGVDHDLYKSTHKNHPCTLWAMESTANFCWLIEHGQQLCIEYTHRYGKRHKCQDVIEQIKVMASFGLPMDIGPMTSFAQAMPDEFKNEDAVQAYRDYYRLDKMVNIDARWEKNRGMPEWLTPNK